MDDDDDGDAFVCDDDGGGGRKGAKGAKAAPHESTYVDPMDAMDDEDDGDGRHGFDAARGHICGCAQPALRYNRDSSGTVCTRCGVTAIQSRMQFMYEDAVRTSSLRAPTHAPATLPFNLSHALEFLLEPATRQKVYSYVLTTTKRVIGKDARHVFDAVGVEHMEPHLFPTAAQHEELVQIAHQYLLGATVGEGVELLVDMVTTLPSGAWYGARTMPWMCACLYPPTPRKLLIDELTARIHTPRAESRDRPDEHMRREEAMYAPRDPYADPPAAPAAPRPSLQIRRLPSARPPPPPAPARWPRSRAPRAISFASHITRVEAQPTHDRLNALLSSMSEEEEETGPWDAGAFDES